MTVAASPKIFVINLDRSHDRLRSIDEQLANMRLGYTRISAVDGDAPSLDCVLEDLGVKVSAPQQRQLSRREVGCYLSHLKAFDALADSDAQSAIILEDDVILDAKFNLAVRSLAARFRGVPVIIKMESWKKRRLSIVAMRIEDFELVFAPHALTETGAYFITKEAVRLLRTELIAIKEPYDDALYRDRAGAIGVLTMSPPVAQQSAKFSSVIEPDRMLMKRKALSCQAFIRELFRPAAQTAQFVKSLILTKQRFGLLAMASLRRRMITISDFPMRPSSATALGEGSVDILPRGARALD